MSGFPEKCDYCLRLFAVYAVLVILFLLNIISFTTPLSLAIEIPFVLMFLYYWAVYRPNIMPPLLVFGLGLLFDLLSGLPLGVSAFIFLLQNLIVSDQRIFLAGQTFIVIWIGFTVVASLSLLVQWFLVGVMHMQLMPIIPVLLMILSGVIVFPFIVILLNITHRALPDVTDSYSPVS